MSVATSTSPVNADTPATTVSSSSSSSVKPPPLAGTLRHIALSSKPSSNLSYIYQHVTQNGWISFSQDNPRLYKPHLLIVFINGLAYSMSSFTLAINRFISSLTLVASARISVLAYDRYSSGLSTDPDPADHFSPDPSRAHDIAHVVRDLRELIDEVLHVHHGTPSRQPSPSNAAFRASSSPGPNYRSVYPFATNPSTTNKDTYTKRGTLSASPQSQPPFHNEGASANDLPSLLLVGHSIGVPIARLFATTYPSTVIGLLLLDSTLTNTDFTSLFPDPSSPDFSTFTALPPGVPESALLTARASLARRFHPTVGNPQGLDRRNLHTLIPHPQPQPLPPGPDGRPPFVTVIEHGWAAFIAENERGLDIDPRLAERYLLPAWRRYHEELRGLTSPERWGGVVEAVGAGHAVQVERSDVVGGRLKMMVEKVLLEAGIVRDLLG
ncbi:MAG: hypothetical protein Q9160_001589 [Pyrenula sp. 1 TL-2023]